MFRIAVKSALARKGRLLLTSLAVIAGCAFLSGVFVFSDTIRGSFDRLFANAYENVDAFVRSSNVIEGDQDTESRDRLPDAMIAEIAALPHVTEVQGDVMGFSRISTSEGKAIGVGGPPKFGGAYVASPSSPWVMDEGRAAENSSEVVIDRRSAREGAIAIGDTVNVTALQGARDFTVVGIVRFGDSDTSGGATWALFDLATAQDFIIGQPGQVDSIAVASDGSISDEELATSIDDVFTGRDVETLTGAEIIEENQSAIEQGLSFFTLFLTIFAAISLFVGSFIIFNVFSISAAQRQQENALLRALGASRRQVTRVLFTEATLVGVMGGVLGFAGGVGLAAGIMKLLQAAGFAPSDTTLTVKPAVLVTSVVVGLVVTMVCAIVPAIRSGRVLPLAAMRDVAVDSSALSRVRLITGTCFVVAAAASVGIGISGSPLWLAPGVIGLFVSSVVLGPIVVGPISNWITKPLGAILGVTGEFAGRNAAKNPKRTALTAGALGIGLALLVGVSTLGSSAKSSIRESIGSQFTGDYAVSTSDNQGIGGLPTSLVDELNQLDEVESALGIGVNDLALLEKGERKVKRFLVVDPKHAATLLDVPFVAGGWEQLDGAGLLMSLDKAERDDVALGDTVTVAMQDKTTRSLKLVGIFDSNDFGNLVVDRTLFEGQDTALFNFQILVQTAVGVPADRADAAIRGVTDNYPTSKVQTREQFIDDEASKVDGFLNFIYGLLLMSVFIAILGIVITLLLSVYERRRELGLVRAVGMTRPQVRSSIRWEALVTAVLGALMGTGLGLALGWIVVKALQDEGLNTFSVSVPSIIIFVLLSMLIAVLAAWFPARRAAKADILQAIATT